MKMFHDYVAIEPDKPEERTASGLHLAQQIKTYPPTGTVRFKAPGVDQVAVGDRVVYKVYASVDVSDDLAVVPFSAVIGVLDGPKSD